MSSWYYCRRDLGARRSHPGAEDVLAAVADDLLGGADLGSAIRDLMRRGLREAAEGPVGGLAAMLDSLAEQRRRILARYDLDALARELAGHPAAEHMRRFGPSLSDLNSTLVGEWMRAADAGGGDAGELVSSLADLAGLVAAGKVPEPSGAFRSEPGRSHPAAMLAPAELVETVARSMASAEALPNSLPFGARQVVRELAAGARPGLGESIARLRQGARQSHPGMAWERRYVFSGTEALELDGAIDTFSELARIDEMENRLRSARTPSDLEGVDLEEVRDVLGADAARDLEALAALEEVLVEGGLAGPTGGLLGLSPAGARRLGERALMQVFSNLGRGRLGRHLSRGGGQSSVAGSGSRPFEPGDPLDLDLRRTIENALRRAGPGLPVEVRPDDFEIRPRRPSSRSATVLMIDLSLSMPARGNFVAAKRVALALETLVSSRFPHDYLGMVGFSERARQLSPSELAALTWDRAYGTNIQHGLHVARRMLAGRPGAKQVLMVTDGEPTAHLGPAGGVVFNFPATAETVEATLAEVRAATRDRIVINSFMLDSSEHLVAFVDRLTRINGGRAFRSTTASLGFELMADFTRYRS